MLRSSTVSVCLRPTEHDIIQHSSCWPVQFEYLADYLFSLTAACLDDAELAADAGYRLSDKPRRSFIEFAASVIWKESDDNWEKRRYFSSKLQKIGGRKFEHDKRFEEIGKWCDGSPGAIIRIVTSEYANGLERYLYADAVRDWLNEDNEKRPYMQLTPEFLKWTSDHRTSYEIRRAFEAAQAITESHRLRANAVSFVEDARRQAQPKPDVTLAETEPVEAA